MTTNASRAPVDLDAFAADGATRQSPRAGAKPDPLAELARIVGQDDPFRALLEAQAGSRPAAPRHAGGPRIEPAFETPAPQLRAGLEPEEAPADAFHRYLADVEHEAAHGPAPHDPAHDGAEGYAPAAERPRGRRRLVMVGAGLGVCVAAVAGAMTWKGMGRPRGADGAPLLVMADKAPLKVAPQDAGGVVIPDQNKQIYERNPKDGQIRIVNREEQPLDVNQVARAAEAAAPVPAAPTVATPSASNALQDSLGEPRRVRTVSVRPEAPPFARDAQRTDEPKPVPAPPSMVLPDAVAGTASAPMPAPRAVKPAPVATAAPVAAPPAAPTTPARPVAVQRVAAATPEAMPDATASTAAASAGGGFAVQLGVRSSDSEARAAFRQLQERYGADLSGRQPLIRQAEVNGKSIFRVRVGPMAREEANGLCSKLQGAGGQCFVAKN